MKQYFLSCSQQILHPRNAFSFGHEISFEHQRLTSLAKETPEDFNLYDMTKKKKNTFTITKDSAVGDLVLTHMTIPDKLRR